MSSITFETVQTTLKGNCPICFHSLANPQKRVIAHLNKTDLDHAIHFECHKLIFNYNVEVAKSCQICHRKIENLHIFTEWKDHLAQTTISALTSCATMWGMTIISSTALSQISKNHRHSIGILIYLASSTFFIGLGCLLAHKQKFDAQSLLLGWGLAGISWILLHEVGLPLPVALLSSGFLSGVVTGGYNLHQSLKRVNHTEEDLEF